MDCSNMFSELKHHCMELLGLLQKPKKSSSTVDGLLHLLQQSSSESLQPFLDYTLFPLLLLLDAAVDCRSSTKSESKDKSVVLNASEFSLKVSDSVAEGVLSCLEEILKKCHLGSVDQMIIMLKKLTHGALLSPSEASEEFRERVIRCFRVMLLNLRPCSDSNCSCRNIQNSEAHKQLQDAPDSRLLPKDLVATECSIAFLQSEPASAAVGHWLSLLLKAADVEATRGHRGSSKIRVEAFMTLRLLVAKVGTIDALAFYLPGITSQIGKVLHASRTMISGAAGCSEALDQAVRCLAEYLGIVLDDDSNISILSISMDDVSVLSSRKEKPVISFLEELRRLPVKNQVQDEKLTDSIETVKENTAKSYQENAYLRSSSKTGSLRVKRTKDWLASSVVHVNKLLSSTFPHLCVHPTRKVRLGLLAAVQVLICKCRYTLKESIWMLLECLFVLVCDDSEEVSSDAHRCIKRLLSSGKNNQLECDIAEVFSRLVEKLPQVILSNEELPALSHAQKLLSITYFCGPRLIAEYLRSPVTAARFLDVFALCLSQKSVFAGSLNKLVSTRPSSSGFMRSIAEIKALSISEHEVSEFVGFQNTNKQLFPFENAQKEYELPGTPPWFVYNGGQKLYKTLAGILRLVSLYMFADTQNEGSFSILIDILLGHLRKLISELRNKEYNEESWQSWYKRTGSGDLVRQASTAACILNEFVFGLSDHSTTILNSIFTSNLQQEGSGLYGENSNCFGYINVAEGVRQISANSLARNHLVNCIGNILHEYLSSEVWDLPLGHLNSLQQSGEDGGINLHFFHDNRMLHQIIIEGIGVFNICLGKDFLSSGFLHSSLFMLLENVICSDFQVRRASDAVLRVFSATHDCPTVGHLVLANSDYVIDSICRQLRHLDLNPHAPNVLSSMLSYVGVADKILPLLEEPIRAVSMELEILSRHQHPNLTISFLKAVGEIAKASKKEACTLPGKAESYWKVVKSKLVNEEKHSEKNFPGHYTCGDRVTNPGTLDYDEEKCSQDADGQVAEWESILFQLNDSKRYRRIVGSVADSCLVAVTPLIASADPAACFAALDVVEDGIKALAEVEEAYKHEKEMKEAIEDFIRSSSFHPLQDRIDVAEDETGENRLLPAMNKIWPFFISCFRNKNLLAIRRCCKTVSTTVEICGGEFFSRRFHSDGAHIWKFLNSSPFEKKLISKDERKSLQLPYRRSSTSSEDSVAEISNLKVQIAILEMISDLSRNKKSAPALEAYSVFKKISGIVVGIACSGVKGLQDACVMALTGLASMDPDLIWLLLANVHYSGKNDLPVAPSPEFPDVVHVFPRPTSSKEFLHVLYGNQSYGFDIDFVSVERVFKKLFSSLDTS